MDDFVGLDEIEIAEIKFEPANIAPACALSYTDVLRDPIQMVGLSAHDGRAGKPLANWTVNHLPRWRPIHHIFVQKGLDMNSNQRSQGNNQSDNGANEKSTSSSRSGVEETNLRQNKLSQQSQHDASMQSAEPEDDPSWGREGQAQPTGAPSEQSDLSRSGMKGRGQEGMQGPGMPNQRVGSQTGTQQGSEQYEHGTARQSSARDSTDRAGSQTGSQQNAGPGVHQSNDVAGGLPKSPGGKHLAADQKMDDDTGLSNTVNRQAAIDEGSKQTQQSNVGRRSDMTPD